MSNLLRNTSRWKKTRERIYADYGQQCAICGAKREDHRLDCHEEWEYDSIAYVQKLKKLVALCQLCHRVKQGLWLSYWKGEPEGASLAKQLKDIRSYREEMAERYREELNVPADKRDLKELEGFKKMVNRRSALEHFVEVNGCDLAVAERHLLEALEEWKRRSQHEWQVDFGEFAYFLENQQ